MIGAICVALLSVGTTQVASENAKLAHLSESRGAFERQYVSPKKESLQVIENLGTNGLGNPGREWYFPAGSAEFRVWIVSYGDTGSLVYQSRHGKKTTTDWVLKLVEGRKGDKATGTVSRMIARQGFRISGRISATQRRVLAQQRPFIGLTEGRGPYQGEIFTWFVGRDGLATKGYYHCIPDPIDLGGGAISVDMSRVLYAPPILPAEGAVMGIRMDNLWHGPGKFQATYGTEFKF